MEISRCTITGCPIGVRSLASGNQVTVSDCVLYGNNNDFITIGPAPVYTNNLVSSPFTPGAPENAFADPLFRDAANGDYRLLPGSPAIDQAVAAGADLDGFFRMNRDGDLDTIALGDLGAYEFRTLMAPRRVGLGDTFELEVPALPGQMAWVAAARGGALGAPTTTPFGSLWLDTAMPLAGVGLVLAPGSATFTVPDDPMFSGLDLAFQALIRNPASPTGAAWSDLVVVRVD